jgi:hypothetical protein
MWNAASAKSIIKEFTLAACARYLLRDEMHFALFLRLNVAHGKGRMVAYAAFFHLLRCFHCLSKARLREYRRCERQRQNRCRAKHLESDHGLLSVN